MGHRYRPRFEAPVRSAAGDDVRRESAAAPAPQGGGVGVSPDGQEKEPLVERPVDWNTAPLLDALVELHHPTE
jgi:hypothetical protein